MTDDQIIGYTKSGSRAKYMLSVIFIGPGNDNNNHNIFAGYKEFFRHRISLENLPFRMNSMDIILIIFQSLISMRNVYNPTLAMKKVFISGNSKCMHYFILSKVTCLCYETGVVSVYPIL